ncbi:MAG: hypothetical protein N2663_04620 [Chlorobi bacterium]|nr:hypothetical protein [Chlorobiota bacterium]
MELVLVIHSHLRWLVAIGIIGALLASLFAVARRQWLTFERWTVRVIPWMLTLQLLLGLILLVGSGATLGWDMPALRPQVEHATTMIVAVGISHMLPRMLRNADVRRSANRAALAILGIGVLVFIGVVRLRGLVYWMPF